MHLLGDDHQLGVNLLEPSHHPAAEPVDGGKDGIRSAPAHRPTIVGRLQTGTTSPSLPRAERERPPTRSRALLAATLRT